ncbi:MULTISPECIES: heavy-metal-associated domain-containing protein [Myxococcus]|uniref:Heavy metal transport/detoxification protein n=1 Tax=Myxococcus xanthus TaxID=34 RepID=A0AAE6G0L2_MYXXA|nr:MULTISPECIES: heavy-metal-associated domain-containing protein [Myxococcus]QDE68506.1 heavy metal transport/detoxification protein [Myxococcus xanthus]QDE75783.1 heavy metal transport/detoxification protein [Myxococcus xanthus]QDE83111.1 heavy metal transport/detoxification protein [Myxococcus xanthus]QDE97352.1 heavy metal transport/detoxification protein [Myxococcus xanthus]QDF04922.1 heavy metal transport/detoxification protein [Myxococcus xanthus]
MNPNDETLLKVEGMSCRSCVSHINTALREVEGVQDVNVRFEHGQVLVKHDAAAANVNTLIEALREAGYESAPTA